MNHERVEQSYRQNSQWHAFTAQAWGAFGTACFFGAISTLAMGLITIAAGIPAVPAARLQSAAASILGGGHGMLLPNLVIGGLALFGVGCSYMSQKHATELRILQDEHMAYQTARCQDTYRSQSPEPKAVAHSHAHPRRHDNRQWADVVRTEQPAEELSATR